MEYEITLKKTHINWGVYRHTDTRDKIPEEGYIPIPLNIAKEYNIFNSNSGNITNYQIYSEDKFLKGDIVIPSGSNEKGSIYAKQFQGKGNLKLIGKWYQQLNASPGDKLHIKIEKNKIFVKLKKESF